MSNKMVIGTYPIRLLKRFSGIVYVRCFAWKKYSFIYSKQCLLSFYFVLGIILDTGCYKESERQGFNFPCVFQ